MKNKSRLLILFFVVGFQNIMFSQSWSNALNQANTAVTTSSVQVKTLASGILWMLAAGAIVYAAYTYWYNPDRSKQSTVSLIGGIILALAGTVMQFIA